MQSTLVAANFVKPDDETFLVDDNMWEHQRHDFITMGPAPSLHEGLVYILVQHGTNSTATGVQERQHTCLELKSKTMPLIHHLLIQSIAAG